MNLGNDKVDIIDIFAKNNKLIIPKYQRGYKWDITNFSELWDDVEEVLLKKDEHHFFGFIILASDDENNSSGCYEIIDGQQRLTTFSILFRAMYDLCGDTNGIKSQIYKKIISKDGGINYTLRLSEVDDPFFEKYIKRQNSDRSKNGKILSHRHIRECYQYFVKSIKEYAASNELSDDEVVNILFDRLETNTHLIVLKTNSDVDAYTIFESINAKRVDLTPAELLKNYFFSTVSSDGGMLAETQSNWELITNNFEESDCGPEITEFIRHYWISSRDDVSQNELYKKVKKTLRRNSNDVRLFISQLSSENSNYISIFNPLNTITQNGVNVSLLSTISSVGYKQTYPTFLSLLSQNITQMQFDVTVTNLTNLFIRRSIIGSNPNEVEKKLSSVSRMIRSNLENGILALNKMIREMSPSDEEIIAKMTKDSKSALVKLILWEYESSLSAQGGKKLYSPTLEHIMPQQPKSYSDWGVDIEEHGLWVQNIGNITLLEKALNSSVKNYDFSHKQEIYQSQKTDINMTKMIISDYKKWGIEEIKARAMILANFVNKRWPDFK